MRSVFGRKLHNSHAVMLSDTPGGNAGHELVRAKAMQKRRSRKSPNSKYSQRIDVLNSYSAGEKLKICIARSLGGIGDVLMTTPTVRAIKTRFPNSELTYATDPKYANGGLIEILENNPYIDKVVPFNQISRNMFHLYADLTSVGVARERMNYPPVNRIDLFAEFVGIDLFDPTPVYVPTREEQLWARQKIQKWTGGETKKVITIHISSVDNRRNWPIQNFIELVGKITSSYEDVFVIIFDQHKKGGWGIKNTKVANNFGIRQVAALIDASQLFIGPDSGLMHIAGALEKHMITLFGSTDPTARVNHYINARYLIDDDCRVCWYNACGRNCMSLISVNDVWKEVKEFVSSDVLINTQLGGNLIIDSHKLFNANSMHIESILSDTLQIGATPVLIGPQKNYISKVKDISVESIDMNDMRTRKYPRSKGIGLLTNLKMDLNDNEKAILNSYDKLLVGTTKAKTYLKSLGYDKVHEWKMGFVVDPKPNIINTNNTEVCKFGCVVDRVTDSSLANLYSIIESFKNAFDRDVEKRLHILCSTIDLDKLSSWLKETGFDQDIRLQVSGINGLIDIDRFYNTIDCYIRANLIAPFSNWSLTALSKGVPVVCDEVENNNLNDQFCLVVDSEDSLYRQDNLIAMLKFFAENKALINEDFADRVAYIRSNYSKTDSAHELFLILKDM